ncbi:MAG: hypothetical protein PHT54_02245 [Candidatus Nanoarchaeia archaeon]|nr:hypothetical protein [Candidatus Nanoarchaeia archaeon]
MSNKSNEKNPTRKKIRRVKRRLIKKSGGVNKPKLVKPVKIKKSFENDLTLMDEVRRLMNGDGKDRFMRNEFVPLKEKESDRISLPTDPDPDPLAEKNHIELGKKGLNCMPPIKKSF